MVKPSEVMGSKSHRILFMLICTFVLWGLPSPTKASIADTSSVNGRYNHPYLKLADSLAGRNEPYKALEAYESAMRRFSVENNHHGLITAACKMAGVYTGLRQYDSAENSLAEALQAFKHIPTDSAFLADIHYRLGVLQDDQFQPDSGLVYHQNALNIRKRNIGEYSEPVASSYNAIADIYRYTFLDYFTAEKYYLNALEIREKIPSEEQYKNLATLCYNLATTYRLKGDTEKAITYAHQAQTFYRMNDAQDYLYFSLCQNVLATTFFEKEGYRESLKHFFNAVGYMQYSPHYSDIYLPTFYTNLGAAYIELNRPDSALIYLNRAMLILKQTGDSVRMVHTYQQMGAAHLKKQPEVALYYYQRSMVLSQRIFGEDHPRTAPLYLDFAKYYQSVQDYESAIKYVRKGLVIMDYEQLRTNIQDQSALKVDVNAILEGLAILSSCQVKLFHKHQEREYLEKALENYLVIDQILNNYRNLMARESSRLELAREFKYTYEEALGCAYALYRLNPNETVANAAFRFMEKNKALVLMDFLRHGELNNIFGVPDSIRTHEQALEAQLSFYTAELYQPKEEAAVAALQSKIFATERQLEKLRNNLAIGYPEYYKIKHSSRFSSLPECLTYLRKKKATLIEYFYGDSSLYALAINPEAEGVFFHKMDDLPAVHSLVDGFLQNFHGDFDMENADRHFHAYTQSAFGLYRLILAPVLSDKDFIGDNRKLIIVPDGILSFVPFEALIDEVPADNRVNYQSLAYLVHPYTFSYSFSAQVLMENNQIQNKSYPANTLVLSYGQLPKTGTASLTASIGGTSEEADYIASLVPATVFSGKDATKFNFMQHVGEAGIVHLALHGRADRVNPLKGAIMFRGEGSEPADESLYYYELMDLGIKARLAVLSACETGLGKHQEGEGVFHIARGFRYAGCPTLVASLWRIDDRSTSQVVKNFYMELTLGRNLDVAMQESKRQYVKHTDELLAHPRYWAGMLLIGDTDPIILTERHPSWHYWLSTLLLFIALFTFLKFRKKVIR